jgi:hypothetical protein
VQRRDKVGVFDGAGAHHHAVGPGVAVGPRLIERSYAAAHLHAEGVPETRDEPREQGALRGRAVAGTIQVDEVHPPRARVDEGCEHLRRVVGVHRDAGVVALVQPHDAAAEEVHRGDYFHGATSVKYRRRRSRPARWLFSG